MLSKINVKEKKVILIDNFTPILGDNKIGEAINSIIAHGEMTHFVYTITQIYVIRSLYNSGYKYL